MTDLLFRDDPYLKTATARVLHRTAEGGLIPDRSLFYPRGGGQPGDSGVLTWDGGRCEIAGAVAGADGRVVLVPAGTAPLPPEGAEVECALDWERRHRFMRMHTALHLLSVVVPLPVTGGQIGAESSRLDFDMPEPIYEREFIQARLSQLVAADHPVTEDWITEEELARNPDLVKTVGARPPAGGGRIRMIRIGAGETPVDLQPCGGTHVRATAEIGTIAVGRIENKGRANRRISITLSD